MGNCSSKPKRDLNQQIEEYKVGSQASFHEMESLIHDGPMRVQDKLAKSISKQTLEVTEDLLKIIYEKHINDLKNWASNTAFQVMYHYCLMYPKRRNADELYAAKNLCARFHKVHALKIINFEVPKNVTKQKEIQKFLGPL